jgi:hypothetical protein
MGQSVSKQNITYNQSVTQGGTLNFRSGEATNTSAIPTKVDAQIPESAFANSMCFNKLENGKLEVAKIDYDYVLSDGTVVPMVGDSLVSITPLIEAVSAKLKRIAQSMGMRKHITKVQNTLVSIPDIYFQTGVFYVLRAHETGSMVLAYPMHVTAIPMNQLGVVKLHIDNCMGFLKETNAAQAYLSGVHDWGTEYESSVFDTIYTLRSSDPEEYKIEAADEAVFMCIQASPCANLTVTEEVAKTSKTKLGSFFPAIDPVTGKIEYSLAPLIDDVVKLDWMRSDDHQGALIEKIQNRVCVDEDRDPLGLTMALVNQENVNPQLVDKQLIDIYDPCNVYPKRRDTEKRSQNVNVFNSGYYGGELCVAAGRMTQGGINGQPGWSYIKGSIAYEFVAWYKTEKNADGSYGKTFIFTQAKEKGDPVINDPSGAYEYKSMGTFFVLTETQHEKVYNSTFIKAESYAGLTLRPLSDTYTNMGYYNVLLWSGDSGFNNQASYNPDYWDQQTFTQWRRLEMVSSVDNKVTRHPRAIDITEGTGHVIGIEVYVDGDYALSKVLSEEYCPIWLNKTVLVTEVQRYRTSKFQSDVKMPVEYMHTELDNTMPGRYLCSEIENPLRSLPMSLLEDKTFISLLAETKALQYMFDVMENQPYSIGKWFKTTAKKAFHKIKKGFKKLLAEPQALRDITAKMTGTLGDIINSDNAGGLEDIENALLRPMVKSVANYASQAAGDTFKPYFELASEARKIYNTDFVETTAAIKNMFNAWDEQAGMQSSWIDTASRLTSDAIGAFL